MPDMAWASNESTQLMHMTPHHTLQLPTQTDNRMAHGHFQTNSIQSQPNPNQAEKNPTNLSNPQLNPNSTPTH